MMSLKRYLHSKIVSQLRNRCITYDCLTASDDVALSFTIDDLLGQVCHKSNPGHFQKASQIAEALKMFKNENLDGAMRILSSKYNTSVDKDVIQFLVCKVINIIKIMNEHFPKPIIFLCRFPLTIISLEVSLCNFAQPTPMD